ncbi:STAS domain-containing protein [Polyangium jinanense]|uniref:STAS domain-containing protein n=1 Tax=Polyangium jinanense TaxID=2829994 RepID=A0A9X3XAD0_9BACT|nr:STAS domain-containing protein [Polyangium jinanense]MDC3957069.1 STAS domain-containing protein [Polyangium jinanense]MDC3987057.1 STAS domain-containing protein [Polyangium jinanense]
MNHRQSIDAEQALEDLARENAALRRRIAELEIPARRYQALFDGGAVSLQVYDPESRTKEVNAGWEQLWHTPVELVADYRLRNDPQVVAQGFMHLIEQAFLEGKATRLPTIRYDPHQNEAVDQGRVRWVASALFPVKGANDEVCEVIQLHFDVGELKHSEEELRQQKDELEAAVTARTAELAEQLRVSEEQQQAIAALSTPVLRIWKGILAVPLIGRIDAARGARILEVLLRSIVEASAEKVILDVTGVPVLDADAARHLRDAVRAAELLGAQCMVVGISTQTARTLVEDDLGFENVCTFATLQEGLRRSLGRR